jgi:hypothetical protein
MSTSIDNIPLKNKSNITDDSDDPMVKDILNEFQHELKSINNEYQQPTQQPTQQPQQQPQQQPPQQPQQPLNYNINYQQPKNQYQQSLNKNNSYYNEDFIRKSGILVIIIAMIFSPLILPAFITKLPPSISTIIDNYQFYFKLLLLFIIFYLMYYKELI